MLLIQPDSAFTFIWTTQVKPEEINIKGLFLHKLTCSLLIHSPDLWPTVIMLFSFNHGVSVLRGSHRSKTATAGHLCLFVKQSEAKWLRGPGTAVSSLQLPLMLSCSQQHTLTFYGGAVNASSTHTLTKRTEKINWNLQWKIWPPRHLPLMFISPPPGAPALLLLESQDCPPKCRMAASFTLHSDYNDSSSYRRANLSIHLAQKCSTIMTSDPYFFSWKRLLPAWIGEWPAGT